MNPRALRHLEAFIREIAREVALETLKVADEAGRQAHPAASPHSRPMRSEWMSTREAAAYVRRKPDTVRRWAAAGHVEARNVGGRAGLEFHRPSLDVYLASRGVPAERSFDDSADTSVRPTTSSSKPLR